MAKQRMNLIKGGIPLVTLTIGGWLGIAYFMQGRIDVEVGENEHPIHLKHDVMQKNSNIITHRLC